MELNKCTRCGCFFYSNAIVCPACEQKDENDIIILKDFFNENEASSIDDLSYQTGISVKNLNRFMELDDFKNIKL